jgi:hypothetical protein
LLHLIASHHGELQFGSPVEPKTPEAIALHYLDNLDARLEMIFSSYDRQPEIAPGIFERLHVVFRGTDVCGGLEQLGLKTIAPFQSPATSAFLPATKSTSSCAPSASDPIAPMAVQMVHSSGVKSFLLAMAVSASKFAFGGHIHLTTTAPARFQSTSMYLLKAKRYQPLIASQGNPP